MPNIPEKLKKIYWDYYKKIVQLYDYNASNPSEPTKIDESNSTITDSELPKSTSDLPQSIQDKLNNSIHELFNDYLKCLNKLLSGDPIAEEFDTDSESLIAQRATRLFNSSSDISTSIKRLNKGVNKFEFLTSLKSSLKDKSSISLSSQNTLKDLPDIESLVPTSSTSYCRDFSVGMIKQLYQEFKFNSQEIESIDDNTMKTICDNSNLSSTRFNSFFEYFKNDIIPKKHKKYINNYILLQLI